MRLNQRTEKSGHFIVYRRPYDIRNDIAAIRARIAETDNMINVRSLLLDALCEFSENEPDRWLPEIEEVVEETRMTLAALSELESTLAVLEDELRRTRWVMGYAGSA